MNPKSKTNGLDNGLLYDEHDLPKQLTTHYHGYVIIEVPHDIRRSYALA